MHILVLVMQQLFGGNSIEVFELQKKIIRTVLFKSKRDTCRDWFRQIQILALPLIFLLKYMKMVELDPKIIINIRVDNDRYNFRSDFKIAIFQQANLGNQESSCVNNKTV